MHSIITHYYPTSYGELIIGSLEDKLCLCDWRYRKSRTSIDNRICKGLNGEYKEGTSEVIENTIYQLEEYFDKKTKAFDIPLLFVGTKFQEDVWNALLGIPYGTTETYGSLSKRLNNLEAVRAVANANGANAISIIVPCHRIIGVNGKLVGYAGGIAAKKKLLELESDGKNQLDIFFDFEC